MGASCHDIICCCNHELTCMYNSIARIILLALKRNTWQCILCPVHASLCQYNRYRNINFWSCVPWSSMHTKFRPTAILCSVWFCFGQFTISDEHHSTDVNSSPKDCKHVSRFDPSHALYQQDPAGNNNSSLSGMHPCITQLIIHIIITSIYVPVWRVYYRVEVGHVLMHTEWFGSNFTILARS